MPHVADERPAARPQKSVTVVQDESSIELRLWARQYVQVLLSVEGVAVIPSVLKVAS